MDISKLKIENTTYDIKDSVARNSISDLLNSISATYAKIDGAYDSMSVGSAKHLEGNVNNPGSFLERTTGDDAELANGLAQLNEVQGGSVKFNQQVKEISSENYTTVGQNTTTSFSDGVASITASVSYGGIRTQKKYTPVVNHKYYLSYQIKSENSLSVDVHINATDVQDVLRNFQSSTFVRKSRIVVCHTTQTDNYLFVWDIRSADWSEFQIKDIQLIDLTAIFGEGNEPSTVAEFEAWLAENVGLKDYYEYTEGEVVNNNMTGIESNGFNLFNPTTGKARIIGAYSEVYGNYYGITGTYGTLTFEDDLGNVSTITPDADGKFELDVSGYLSVADAGNDVAVFLWWDGKKTEYEDYDVEIAHLDVRHVYGKKNGTGELVQVWPTGMPRINDVVDKLCIENGAVVAKRSLGEVDLGDLTWTFRNTDYFLNHDCFSAPLSGSKHYAGGVYPTILCSKYVASSGKNIYDQTIDKAISGETDYVAGSILVRDTAYSDAATFKTAMSGVLLYYELATPETYTDLVYMGSEYFADGTPVTLPVNYKVDNWGVESILPKNTSTILTAKPTIKVRYAIDAVEQLNTHSDEIDSLHDDIDELNGAKANTVGVYDNLVVGAAKAIAGNQRLDKEFTSMVVDGADGVAKINEVRGKSLVWNQLVKNPTFEEGEQSPTYYILTGCTATRIGKMLELHPQEGSTTIRVTSSVHTKGDHKYYFSVYSSYNGSSIGSIAVTSYNNSTYTRCWSSNINSTLNKYSAIVTSTADGVNFILDLGFVQSGVSSTDVVQVMYPIVVDLTQMFGAGNEPATVAEFEKLFPDAYYEYNDGEIINNATEKLDVTGFNQWDEEWESGYYNTDNGTPQSSNNYHRSKNPIKVFPNTNYYVKGNSIRVLYYKNDGTFIKANTPVLVSDSIINTPNDCGYIHIYTTVETSDNICINISDPSRNGTYEPYKHGILPLNLSTITGKQVGVEDAESVVIFPDGMRQAGSVADALLVDDDGYARRALVKIGSVDLGTMAWTYNSSYGFLIERGNLPSDFKKSTNGVQIKCNKFETISIGGSITEEKLLIGYSSYLGQYLFIRNSDYSDAATFKTAMSGVKLYYELAEYKEYILDEPILMTFKAYHGGTIVQSPQAPDSAPMSMNVTFALDAVGTLNNLPKNYISADSMDAFLAQLGTAMNGTWTKSWDAANNRYDFTFTPNTEGE